MKLAFKKLVFFCFTLISLSCTEGSLSGSAGLARVYFSETKVIPSATVQLPTYFSDTTYFGSTVFAVGAYDNGPTSIWGVWSSLDGASWTLLDSYRHKAASQTIPTAIFVADNNTIYVVGHAIHPTTTSRKDGFWLVRKTSDGGLNWTTVDEIQENDISSINFNIIARDVAVSGNQVFVVGELPNAGRTQTLWTVRRSLDGGETWTTVDSHDFVTSTGGINRPRAIHIHGGTIYVGGNFKSAGSALTDDSIPIAFIEGQIRGSSDNGSTWSNVLLSSNNNIFDLTTAPNGNLWVAGHWGSIAYVWELSGPFLSSQTLANGTHSYRAFRKLIVQNGHVYALGNGETTTPNNYFSILKSFDGSVWSAENVFDNCTVNCELSDNFPKIETSIGAFEIGSNILWFNNKLNSSYNSLSVDSRVSSDGGSTYSAHSDFLHESQGASSISSAFVDDTTIILNGSFIGDFGRSHSYVLKSTDAGNTWTTLDDYIFSSSSTEALHILANSTNLIYAGKTPGGQFVRASTDSGATWSTTLSEYDPDYGAEIHSLLQGLGANQYITYSDANDTSSSFEGIASTALFAGFTPSFTGSGGAAFNSPFNKRSVFTASHSYIPYDSKLIHSTDGGTTWSEDFETSISISALVQANDETLVASSSTGTFKYSTDFGSTWTASQVNSTCGTPLNVKDLIKLSSGYLAAIISVTTDDIFTSDCIFMSTDHGRTFSNYTPSVISNNLILNPIYNHIYEKDSQTLQIFGSSYNDDKFVYQSSIGEIDLKYIGY